MFKNICVYGVGGVGGYFGAKIASGKAGVHLTFIARGSHLEAIKQDGLTLISDQGEFNVTPSLATDNIQEAPKADLYLICVKGYDMENAVRSIAERIDDDTLILPILNGIDIYERVRKVTDKGIVLPACIYVGTHIFKPGTILQKGGDARLIIGDDPEKQNSRAGEVQALLESSGISCVYQPDPYPAIWTKYMFIAAYGLVTAVTGKTLGEVFAEESLRNDVKAIMEEILAIAAKEKIALDPDIVEVSLNKAQAFPFEAKTSFQRDVENPEKKNEKELFAGTIIRLGLKNQIKTLVTERYYGNLR